MESRLTRVACWGAVSSSLPYGSSAITEGPLEAIKCRHSPSHTLGQNSSLDRTAIDSVCCRL